MYLELQTFWHVADSCTCKSQIGKKLKPDKSGIFTYTLNRCIKSML